MFACPNVVLFDCLTVWIAAPPNNQKCFEVSSLIYSMSSFHRNNILTLEPFCFQQTNHTRRHSGGRKWSSERSYDDQWTLSLNFLTGLSAFVTSRLFYPSIIFEKTNNKLTSILYYWIIYICKKNLLLMAEINRVKNWGIMFADHRSFFHSTISFL